MILFVSCYRLISLHAKGYCDRFESSIKELERELSGLMACEEVLERHYDEETEKSQLLKVT